MKLFTIGFTKKRAEDFFDLLSNAGVERVVDVRLNNMSQLSGFAKKNDLAYFLQKICAIEYVHVPILAPTKDIFDAYKKNGASWQEYENLFLDLLLRRRIEDEIDPAFMSGACLLCSEHEPHHCHRRLVAEYLGDRWGNIEIEHLTE